MIPTRELAPGYRVPRLIVGAWQLSAGHRRTPRDPTEVMDDFSRMVDAGLVTFDCADIYTGVETFLGELRRRYARSRGPEAAARIRIHTKLVPDYDDLTTLRRTDVDRIVNRSLARLGVERLDLVQLAWWDYGVERWVEVAQWLDDLRRAGKIASLGATNFDVPSLEALLDAGIPLVAHQVQYSALDHRPERGMVERCRAGGVGLLCYGALAGGFLSDRYRGRPDPTPPLPNRSLVKYRLIVEEYGGWGALQELLDVLHDIAAAHGTNVAQVALRYVLDRPGVTSIILGASRFERVREAVGALELEIRAEEMDRIRMLARAARGPAGPVFGLERDREGPHGRIMKYNLNREG